MVNSRQKGAVGEREWASWLNDWGYPARRGRQFHGRDDAPDVVCEALAPLHFEVKRVERLNIREAIEQCRGDANGKIPVVAHRTNGTDWLITLSAEDFFKRFVPPWNLSRGSSETYTRDVQCLIQKNNSV